MRNVVRSLVKPVIFTSCIYPVPANVLQTVFGAYVNTQWQWPDIHSELNNWRIMFFFCFADHTVRG